MASLQAAPAGETLADDLREFCLSAKPHQAILAERKLADQYEISHGTVRRVLDDLQADGLIYKVHGKGTFVAPPRENKQVPVVIYADTLRDATHPFFVRRFHGMMVAAEELDLRLEVLHCDLHLENTGRLLSELARQEVRGVVLPTLSDDLLSRARAANPELSFVVTATDIPPPGGCSVSVDYLSMGKMAIDYLAGHGVRRPICVLAHGLTQYGVERAGRWRKVEPRIVEVPSVLSPDIAAAVAHVRQVDGDGLMFDDDRIAKAVLAELGPLSIPIVSHANAGVEAPAECMARLEVDGEAFGRELLYLLHDRLSSRQRANVHLSIPPILIESTSKEPTHAILTVRP